MLARPRRRHGASRLAAVAFVVAAFGLIAASPAVAAGPLYCDGGLAGAVTGAEHSVRVGDPPLPAGVSERRLAVDGISTRLIEAGPSAADEAVVFVHGNPGSARDFDGLVARTGRFARAIAFDVPGLGHADDRRGLDYSTDGAARYVGRVIEELGVRRVHLVLHDLGGIWGLQWAVGSLDAVRSVSLIDTGVLVGYFGHPLGLSWTVPVLGEAEMAAITRDQFKGAISVQDPLPATFLDRMYDDFDRATRCATLDYYRSIGVPDELGRRQAAVLRRADLPALVVWGARDNFVPVSVARTQTQAFPSARIEVLAGAGHWPQLDSPAAVESLVAGFLEGRVRSPRLVLAPLRARAGRRAVSARVSVDGAAVAPGVRVSLLRGGRVVSGPGRARTLDRVARRVTLRVRQPLRRGARYTLRAESAELGKVTRAIRVAR